MHLHPRRGMWVQSRFCRCRSWTVATVPSSPRIWTRTRPRASSLTVLTHVRRSHLQHRLGSPSFPTFSVPVMRRFISDPPTPNPGTARTRPAGPPGPGQEPFGVAQAEGRRHGPEPRASGSRPLGARAKPGSRHPGRSPRRRFACDLRPPSPWRPEVLGSSTRSGTSALRLEPPESQGPGRPESPPSRRRESGRPEVGHRGQRGSGDVAPDKRQADHHEKA